MLAVEHEIGELPYPVAQYQHPGRLVDGKVKFDVPVPEQEKIDVAM